MIGVYLDEPRNLSSCEPSTQGAYVQHTHICESNHTHVRVRTSGSISATFSSSVLCSIRCFSQPSFTVTVSTEGQHRNINL